jgi:hypothetical protein
LISNGAGNTLVVALDTAGCRVALEVAAERKSRVGGGVTALATFRPPVWSLLGVGGPMCLPVVTGAELTDNAREDVRLLAQEWPCLAGMEVVCLRGGLGRAIDRILRGGGYDLTLIGAAGTESAHRRAADRLHERASRFCDTEVLTAKENRHARV